MSTKISKRTVDAAKPAIKDYFIWDTDISGFGLKVTPAGGKVYIFQYRIARAGEAERTPPKRYTIGKHGNLTADQARNRVRELAMLVELGIDPRQRELDQIAVADEAARSRSEKERIEQELSFSKVSLLWLDHYENEKSRRPASVSLAKLVVNRYLKPALGDTPMPHITRAGLQPIIDAIPAQKKGMRRAVFAYASVLFGWAARRGDIPSNPLTEMVKPDAPKSRDRVLTDNELAKLWFASKLLRDPFGPFFRLLMLTGQRRSEVAEINWNELDQETAIWTIPAHRAKNGLAHIVPLVPAAIAELDYIAQLQNTGFDKIDITSWPREGFLLTTTGRTPISGITKAKNALDAAASDSGIGDAVPAWRIHDLRRTMATGFQRLGVRFEVTEATLNHVSGAKGGIAGIYQKHDWKQEKRDGLEAWARHVEAIIKPESQDNIFPLQKSMRAK
ncbi:tyrosine-type recombinase/integrase [Sphingorhabdus sp.]|uniref:tyrosine-type recombinase/integrase n=1 Tax=Sphingorhabdus sp. TaxID=1902408 RepID=UPI00391BDF92